MSLSDVFLDYLQFYEYGCPKGAPTELAQHYSMTKLTKRKLDSTTPRPDQDVRLWDDDPRGFGVRIKPSGVKTFFVQYRSPVTDKKIRHSIGQYGRLSLDEARTKAKKLLGSVADDHDPALEKRQTRQDARSTARTVGELCDDYMRDAHAGVLLYRGRPKKPATLAIDEGRVRRHINPLLGHRLVKEVTSTDVTRFMHDVRTGKTAIDEKTGPRGRARVTGGAATASRTVELLGAIFSYAVRNGLRADNPVKGVERLASQKRDRALTPDEYQRLGNALAALEAEGANPFAIAAFRLLAVTGCRRNEVLSLRSDAVDTHRQALQFADTKTGPQLRVIGKVALSILEAVRAHDDRPYVFPASSGSGHLVGIKVFRRAVERAELKGVSIHTLRHSFASSALELDYSELTIAGLLGHHSHSVTSRYTHHVDRALVAAADRVSRLIAERMGLLPQLGVGGPVVVDLALTGS